MQETEAINCPKHFGGDEICTERMNRIKSSVILIEEDTDMRWLMRYLLVNAGFEVIVFQSDSFLIERIERLNPDILLMDLQWPPSERLALISQLRKSVNFGAIPIIALVMDKVQGEESLRVGATAILRKPDDVRQLPDMIENLILQPYSRWVKSG